MRKIVCLSVLGLINFILLGCVDTSALNSSKKQIAQANIQLGLAYLQEHKMQMAKQKLLAALAVAPKYPVSWYSMAYYYEITEDNDSANRFYLQALTLVPQDSAANNNYGVFLCQQGKYQQAISRFLIAAQNIYYLNSAAA